MFYVDLLQIAFVRLILFELFNKKKKNKITVFFCFKTSRLSLKSIQKECYICYNFNPFTRSVFEIQLVRNTFETLYTAKIFIGLVFLVYIFYFINKGCIKI